jgi:glycosyltransferase 2 family protein
MKPACSRATNEQPGGGKRTKGLRNRPVLVGFSVLLALAGVGFAIGVPLALGYHETLAALRTVSSSLVMVLAATALVSAMAKAGKLHLIQSAMGLRLRFARTLGITLVSDSAFLVSPFGAAGYGVNLGLLQRAGATWPQSTAVVGGDQALDLAFFAIAVPLSLLSCVPQMARVLPPLSPGWIGIALAAVCVFAAAAWKYGSLIVAAVSDRLRRIKRLDRLRVKLRASFDDVLAHWRELLRGSRWRLAALLTLTCVQWLLRYGALWYILRTLGYALSPGFVIAAQALLLHAALWTGIPAGGGSGDLALAAAFAPWVTRPVMATALILWRFATLFCPLVLGGIGMMALSLMRLMSRAPAQ